MIKALFTAATGMRAQQARIDVIANNLANVNTTGFKKSNTAFEDLLYSTLQDPGAQNGDGSTRPAGLQIGAGARLVSTSKVFTNGVLEETGRPLDLVVTGPGFFKLTDLAGGTVYTRDGNFSIDATGALVNSLGLKLDPPITVPPGAEVSVSIDGTVTARIQGEENSQNVGQILLANFPNPAGLDSIGSNMMRETAASGAVIEGTPGSDGLGGLSQGFLEKSNVEVVNELVNLIVSQRAYETNSRAISAADEMLTTVNQIVR